MTIEGLGDKRRITAAFAGTLAGEFLPVQLLYLGKIERAIPITNFPEGFDIMEHPQSQG